MKRVLFIAGSFLLVLSFQNCGQPGAVGGLGAEPAADSINMEKQSAKDARAIAVNDDRAFVKYEIDLANGRVNQKSLRDEQVIGEKCISREKLDSLKALLAESEVCKPIGEEVRPDVQCTQIYRYPYAILESQQGEAIRLGEALNGCMKPVDLCGEKGMELRNALAQLIANIDREACD